MLRAAALLVALVAALGLPAVAAAQVPLPRDDPFYTPPTPLPDVPPGTILRSRTVSSTAVGIPLPVRSWQVLYRTTDTHGAPVATVATIVLPLTPAPLKGRPLVSYQTAEDSLTTDCAPSIEMRRGTEAEMIAMVLPMLLSGAAVVVPDYEGPDSQWAAGHMAGHAVLDAVRAAQRFAPAGLRGSATPVGLWGYSGGGHATTWAAELQPSYAPELNVKGAAAGGVPADIEVTARHLDGGAFAGIYLAAAVGISRAYPEMDIQSLLNPAGKAMVEDIGNQCIEDFTPNYAFRRMSEFTTVPDPLVVPRVRAMLEHNGLGRRAPRAPLFIYHSILDELNPIAPTDGLVATYCHAGVAVKYYRDPASEHISLVATGAPLAAAYLADRFAGKPAPSTC